MPFPRTCVGCASVFDCRTLQQFHCKPHCGRKDTRKRTRTDTRKRPGRYRRIATEFVAVDGEGVTLPDGTHRYVLLSVGDKSITNPAGLTYSEIFAFLWKCHTENETAAFVGFYLGYDFAQWLRTLPEERARMLLSREGMASRKRRQNPVPFSVRFDGWEFDMLPHRRMKLRPEGEASWLYICDAGPFFQTSFLTAIDPKSWRTPILTDDEFATILAGKERRSTASLDDDMIRYNVTENAVMARLMREFDKGLQQIGVNLKRSQYFGPGQAASEWLKTTECLDIYEFRDATPEKVRDAARAAYYGGWFEIRRHGHVNGASYQYDINSAYPAEIASLPCLKHGRWYNDGRNTPYTLIHARVVGSGVFGPVPHRTPDGRILRPQVSQGWYWKHELEAAYAAGLLYDHQTFQAWSYEPCDCAPPLAKVAELYELRRSMGKDTPTGRAAKLVYNSIYGKFAQSAGEPKWANPVYASLITAGCRIRIMQAMARHPLGAAAVSMIATDSVTFDSPCDLPISDTLGEWSVKQSDNLTLFAPGIYWDDATRERIRDGRSVALKSRGVPASDVAAMVAHVDWMFSLWEPSQPWPSVKVPIRFRLITCEQALAWGKWHIAGNVRTNTTRELNSDPHDKRASVFRDDRSFYTIPYPKWYTLESEPYSRTFGEELEDRRADAAMGPDGSIDALFAEALGVG